MSELKLQATPREGTGKNVASRMRRESRIPANVLGEGKAQSVSLDEKGFNHLLGAGLRQSSVIGLSVEGTETRVIVKEIQRHPVTDRVLHVDFLAVVPGKRTVVRIAVETTGTSKGVKAGGALEHFIRVLKVKTVPEKFQDVVKVDISNLDVGDAVHLQDLNLPVEWDHAFEGNPIVCKVSRSRMAADAAADVEAAAPEGESEGEAEEPES